VGGALLMKQKAIITPETRDKKGILYSTEPNPLLDSWLTEIELHIGNERETHRGGTGLGIFYLKNVDKVTNKESIFGYTNRFEGLGIYLNTILRSEQGDKEVVNAI
jgi:hypothetical protein